MEKKIILVTGASSGIGMASAARLSRAGHIVYGAARNVERMDSLKKLGVSPLRMDVTRAEEREEGLARALRAHGRIDVLFNNAGFGAFGAVEDVGEEEAHRQFEVNVFGLAAMTRLVLPGMRERTQGLVINTSSIAGKIESPLGGWYHATKHAVEALSDSLRLEVEQFGIHVVILEPGLINTNFYKIAGHNMLLASDDGAYARMASAMMDTFSKIMAADGMMSGTAPEEVADVVLDIVNSARPRTRYSVGKMAKLSLFSRVILSDRVFDRIMAKQAMPRSRN